MTIPDPNGSININHSEGDVIGIGVSGSGNIIGKNLSIVINEAQSYGLNLLTTNYFREHKTTEQDLEDWIQGFPFKLEAIKEKRELRRNIVDKIKGKLERDHRLLVLGESGTSKSTILMETICEYFDSGYKILYNFGEAEIKNSVDLVKFVEGLLKGNNKVLIAVDNVHSERTAAIFYIIDQLYNYEFSKNLLVILTARLPEFDWFVNDRLNVVEESYRHSIRKFTQISQSRYEIEPFTKTEIEQFIEKYSLEKITPNQILSLASKIYDNTKGNPIMVKFYVFGKGLLEDVRERYDRYLFNSMTMQHDSEKIQTIIVCSLLDIANLPITDKLLEQIDILSTAYALEHAMLYQYSDGLWKTIHTKWDMELLSFLYYEKNKSILLKRKEYLKKALDLIFNLSDEYITASIIQTIYDIASLKKIPINVVESTTKIPDYLTVNTKYNLYLLAIASTYKKSQMYTEMLHNCNKSLDLKPNDVNALNAKTLSLGFIKKYDEALECCNKIIEIDPSDVAAWTNKGLVLSALKRYNEALECWKKAIEIDDVYVSNWNKKDAASLQDSKVYDTSVINRILVIKLVGKGVSFAYMKKYKEALECSDKALELDANNSDTLNNKAWSLNGLKRYEEALECSNKALELDLAPNNSFALNNKAVALNGLKRYEEALECSDKALDLNPYNDWTWFIKGLIFNGLKRYEEALQCNNKALELDANNDWTWNNKAWSLINLGQDEEALQCSNKALELDPNNAWSWNNKSLSLKGLKRYEEALQCNNKALELDDVNAIPTF